MDCSHFWSSECPKKTNREASEAFCEKKNGFTETILSALRKTPRNSGTHVKISEINKGIKRTQCLSFRRCQYFNKINDTKYNSSLLRKLSLFPSLACVIFPSLSFSRNLPPSELHTQAAHLGILYHRVYDCCEGRFVRNNRESRIRKAR